MLLQLTVTKEFSLFLNVPSRLIRGEEVVLEVHVINHLERDIEVRGLDDGAPVDDLPELPALSPQVILLLAQSDTFQFVLANKADVSVVNAQKLTLGSHVSAVALFPVRPVVLGVMDITVDAVSAEASDSLVRRVLVKVCVMM